MERAWLLVEEENENGVTPGGLRRFLCGWTAALIQQDSLEGRERASGCGGNVTATPHPKGDPVDWIMGDLNAPYDSEKVTFWLEEKQGAIDEANENYRQAQLDLAQAEQETGIKGWVINDRSYEHLIGLEFENIVVLRRLSLLTLFALTMLVTPVFVFDRQCGTDRLIHETGKGKRGVFLRKQTAVFLLTVITFVIIYGSRTVTVARQWDLSGLEAPLQSIRWFMRYPLRISIGGFLLLQGILQIAMMYAAAQIMLAFSLFFQKITGALAVNLVIFVVPAALWCVGNGLLPIWNFGSLLSVSETLYGPYYETGLSHILTYVGMVFCGLAAFLFSAGQVGKG